MTLDMIDNYEDKVAACWMGKAIAGGIGAPYEGVLDPLSLTSDDIYIQPGPNDDLELQLLWLFYAEKYGLNLDAEKLSDAWLKHIKYGMDEYGIAIWNLQRGLKPPFTGVVDNWFVNGLGAAIRSEIWACLFPGNPEIAGHYASQDAVIDHHDEGVWAEIFLSSAESLAFVTGSIRKSLEQGLKFIPENSKINEVIRYVFNLYDKKLSPDELRPAIMKNFGSHNFTDCIMGLGFVTAALLFGEGDFLKTVVMAVNFGKDTDCTAATCGAFLGITHGSKIFPETLLEKFDYNVAISPYIGIRHELPQTFPSLTKRTVSLAQKLEAELLLKNRVFDRYKPVDKSSLHHPTSNSWIMIDNPDEYDIEQIKEHLLENKSCSEYLNKNIIAFDSINMDLSDWVKDFNIIHLFSFLTIKNTCDNPLIMACANTGITVWIDDKQVLNYHGRQNEIPALHRAEGGGSFYYPFEPEKKYLVHIRLLNCKKPLRFSMAIGDTNCRILKDFNLKA